MNTNTKKVAVLASLAIPMLFYGDVYHAYHSQSPPPPAAVTPTLSKTLTDPTPHFAVMKKYYPMYNAGRTRNNDLVYYENMGAINMAKLRSHGVTVPILLSHYKYQTEFAFAVLAPVSAPPSKRMLTVFDASNVSLRNLRGDAARFLLAASKENQEGNADRNAGIVIANAPGWFSSAWGLLGKLNAFNEDTMGKTKILRSGKETYEGLNAVIEHEYIPAKYGGGYVIKGEDNGVWDSEEEVRLRKHVYGQAGNKKQVGEEEGIGECPERRQ